MSLKTSILIMVIVFFALTAFQSLEGFAATETNFEAILETGVTERPVTAFVNVNVIPMDTERVLKNQTVIVVNNSIAAIGLVNEIEVPDGARIVEGNSAYLIPGLADMHMHFTSLGQTFKGPDQLRVYLAEGVTTVRNFTGMLENLAWRDQVVRGERVWPSIFTAGPVIVGILIQSCTLGFGLPSSYLLSCSVLLHGC